MEIGNENGGAAYSERYALFHDAIKAKYPNVRLIANEWSGRPDGRPLDIVDEHYYSSPEFFIQNAGKYDSYDRAGYKVYVGEYACTQGCGQGNLRAAVGEAAFMTGMERNSDVVFMSSYAPLFANVNYKRWNPDLINFDSSRVYGLPGYYVQKMFAEYRGDNVLPVSIASPEVKPPDKAGMIGVGTWRTRAEFKDMQVTRNGQVLFAANFANGMRGWKTAGGEWSVADGALRQTSLGDGVRAFAGDKAWNNYTYSLKARKIDGEEGFLIPFAVQNEESKLWWNIGGWSNTRHALEMEGVTPANAPGRIETGRWYDIRIEVAGSRIKCYLDDTLVHDAVYPQVASLYACASRSRNHAFLKVVNASFEPQETLVNFNGVRIASEPLAAVLTSENGADENSLDQPTRIVPKPQKVTLSGSGFRHTFPANSVTAFKLKVR
jgi:alpha-L-arabinofuranosidase